MRRLDEGPLRIGSRAEVKQPGLRRAVFEVTELVPESEFTWDSAAAGVVTSARHLVLPRMHDRAGILLSVDQTGPLARPLKWLLGDRIRWYLAIESAGLATAAEAHTV